MKRTELNLAERRTIEDLLHLKVNVTEIARRINRHRSTVYREIKRNFYCLTSALMGPNRTIC